MFGWCCAKDSTPAVDQIIPSGVDASGLRDGEDEPGCYAGDGDEEWGEEWNEGWEHWEEGEGWAEEWQEEQELNANTEVAKAQTAEPAAAHDEAANGTASDDAPQAASAVGELAGHPETTPEPPKGPPKEQGPGIFRVQLHKKRLPNNGLGRCGIALAHRIQDSELMVEGVCDGSVLEWNAAHPEKAVKENDRIIEINGFRDGRRPRPRHRPAPAGRGAERHAAEHQAHNRHGSTTERAALMVDGCGVASSRRAGLCGWKSIVGAISVISDMMLPASFNHERGVRLS
mmetsp:Transcript_167028/g.536314  ORF Transcript_167028/g.536314 Transcript_167028/m.536314 type:complete len:287 (+) Transcript_167028:134-994(+)